jgi:hypothetical protein
MGEEQMISATRGVESVIEGPMSEADAQLIWAGKADSVAQQKKREVSKLPPRSYAPAMAAAPMSRTPSPRKRVARERFILQSPTNAEIEEAWTAGLKRVFSCWVSPTVGRVALSWEAAAEDIVDPEVRVTSSEPNLFLNIAKAERILNEARKPAPVKSVAQRMADARAAMSTVHAGASSAAPLAGAAAASATSTAAVAATSAAVPPKTSGQLGGTRCALSGVVRTKEALQITRSFVDAKHAVRVDHVGEPTEVQLFGELAAPGEKTFIQRTIGAPKGAEGVTLKDYMMFKDSTAKAWPLKKFGEFMAFCDLGRSLCAKSSKPVAVVNAAFFAELSAMAVRVYNNMARRGALGADEFRFSVRMYMSLQVATNELVLHVGTAAMRFMMSSVDEFSALRISKPSPRVEVSTRGPEKAKRAQRQHSGCYMCPSQTHQAWDVKFHPRNADGSRKKISDADKGAILQRIQQSGATTAEKAGEAADVKRYWAQHSL